MHSATQTITNCHTSPRPRTKSHTHAITSPPPESHTPGHAQGHAHSHARLRLHLCVHDPHSAPTSTVHPTFPSAWTPTSPPLRSCLQEPSEAAPSLAEGLGWAPPGVILEGLGRFPGQTPRFNSASSPQAGQHQSRRRKPMQQASEKLIPRLTLNLQPTSSQPPATPAEAPGL